MGSLGLTESAAPVFEIVTGNDTTPAEDGTANGAGDPGLVDTLEDVTLGLGLAPVATILDNVEVILGEPDTGVGSEGATGGSGGLLDSILNPDPANPGPLPIPNDLSDLLSPEGLLGLLNPDPANPGPLPVPDGLGDLTDLLSPEGLLGLLNPDPANPGPLPVPDGLGDLTDLLSPEGLLGLLNPDPANPGPLPVPGGLGDLLSPEGILAPIASGLANIPGLNNLFPANP